MEPEKDRSFDALAAIVVPKIKSEFESVVRHLRPPRYPYPIDAALAAQGRELFYSPDIGCHRCHGTYDGRGSVQWPGVHVDVGTDRARLDVVTAGFISAFDASPLAGEGSLIRSRGYAATPTGVWANFPYLHNGSVPTLHQLLGPVSERPRVSRSSRLAHWIGSEWGSRSTPIRETGGSTPRNASSGSAGSAIGSMRRVLDLQTSATISGRKSGPTQIGARSSSTSKHSKRRAVMGNYAKGLINMVIDADSMAELLYVPILFSRWSEHAHARRLQDHDRRQEQADSEADR